MQIIEVQSAGITDTGKMRTDNQDQFLVAELTRSMIVRSGALQCEQGSRLFGGTVGHLFLVADGMGGHRGGSEASKFAVEFFANSILNSTSWLARIEPASEAAFIEELKGMLENAHRAIEERSKTMGGCEGMGTTLTLAYVAWPRLIVVHAGDTRCYLLRRGDLRLLTRDHTVANEMMRKGQLAPEEMERSHWSNVLVNALGAGAESVYPDIYKLDLEQGDSILLCSDGLNKHVADFQIQRALVQASDPLSACEELVSLAKQGGGSDNITVAIARFIAPNASNNRMQMVMSRPTTESILQELAYPDSETDTLDEDSKLKDDGTTEDQVPEQASTKDTLDFSDIENGSDE